MSQKAMNRDDRLTLLAEDQALCLAMSHDGTTTIERTAEARQFLKSRRTEQAGFYSKLVRMLPQRSPSVLFQEGELHRAQRAIAAPLFTQSAVVDRRPVIESIAARIVDRFRLDGTGVLDQMALELTVDVVAEFIGLTDGPRADLARRFCRMFDLQASPAETWLQRVLYILRVQRELAALYLAHVRPAIRKRKENAHDDLVSRLIRRGANHLDIVTECVTYGPAGLSTTREFIGVAALHLLASDGLRRRFVDGDEKDRKTILGEILRLEPPVSQILRRTTDQVDIDAGDDSVAIEAGKLVVVDLRGVNSDPAVAGSCPHRLDPNRVGAETGGLSFGFGHHRCPGAALAIEETAIFLHRLLQVPGLRLASTPTFGRHPVSTGYVVRHCRLHVG